MTWPNTPIPTNSTDSAGASLVDARQDIDTMMNHTQDMREQLDIADATTGQFIQYDGTKWKNSNTIAAVQGLYLPYSMITISEGAAYDEVSTDLDTHWPEQIISEDSTGSYILQAGRYIFVFQITGWYLNTDSVVQPPSPVETTISLELSDSTTFTLVQQQRSHYLWDYDNQTNSSGLATVINGTRFAEVPANQTAELEIKINGERKSGSIGVYKIDTVI